jgi:6-phosphogluconolactonase
MQMAGCLSLGTVSVRLPRMDVDGRAAPRFVYVGYTSRSNRLDRVSEHGISVFAVEGEGWKPIERIAITRPSFLTLHPSERFLYAIQEVDQYQNLPTGVVCAYAINERDGSLTPLNRQPLSLSGTLPRHASVSPDGRALVVAVHGGGAYNVLPIHEDGSLGRVSGILKETGSGPDEEHQQTAHPQMVMFDRTGRRFVGADLGSDRLSVFTMDTGGLRVVQRSEVQAGSGPWQMAFHPGGHLLFVANALAASVSCFRYDSGEGRILERTQHVSTNSSQNKNAVVMAIHPSGSFLYTANRSGSDGVTVWRIDPNTGALKPIQSEAGAFLSLHAMTMVKDGGSLLALNRKDGSMIRWHIDCASGLLSRPVQVARVPAPVSLALKYS